MFRDRSLYEMDHPNRIEQAFGIAFGRVVDVDAKARTCTVVTFHGKGTLDDQYIPDAQWINMDSNPEGDESTSIPRPNSLGLVFWVQGEAFIFGYFKPMSRNGSLVTGNEPTKLIAGDKIIATVAGNRITVKASGAIEIYSATTLQRIMIPKGGAIFDLCQRYQLKADGGFQDWRIDPLTQLTTHKAEYRRDIIRSIVMTEARGGVDLTTIYKRQVGPGIPGVEGVTLPSYTETISNLGVVETHVTPPLPLGSPIGVHTKTGPDGSYSFKSGPIPNFELDISPTGAAKVSVNKIITIELSAAGAFTLKNPTIDISASVTGDFQLKNPLVKVDVKATGAIILEGPGGTVSISNAGEMKFTALTKIILDAKAGVDVKSMGPVKIEALGPVDIKAKGAVNIDAGPGATDNVLCYPTTLSPFTGAPLVPFSTTVKVSK